MKSSVCVFTQESPAKLILQKLRDNYLHATHTHLDINAINSGTDLHVIEAEEKYHSAILEEIAESEETHPFLFRCSNCESARICLNYGGPFSHFLRTFTSGSITTPLRSSPSPNLTCRSCHSLQKLGGR
ncbi:MAG: hypothetical protein CMO55_27270 [Verrucomicrobiales bacterium]|nr:hypothetical protein [Verrucomicrobiales bacterium]